MALKLGGDGGLLLETVNLLGWVGFEVEEFMFWITTVLLVDDELEAAIDDGARTKVVHFARDRMTVVLEVPGRFATHEFGERRGALLQLGINVRFCLDVGEAIGVVGPKLDWSRALGQRTIEEWQKIDPVQRAIGQRLADEGAERRQEITGVGADGGAAP